MSKNSGSSFGMTKMPSYNKNTSLVPPLKMNGKDVSNGLDYKEMRNDLINKFSITAPRANNSTTSA
jgi:hypothetical protein